MANELPTVLIPNDADFSVTSNGPVVTHYFSQGEVSLMAVSLHPGTYSLPNSPHSKLTVIAGAIELNEGGKLRIIKAGESTDLSSGAPTIAKVAVFTQATISRPRIRGEEAKAPANVHPIGPRPKIPSPFIAVLRQGENI